jgi:hypothetical protein
MGSGKNFNGDGEWRQDERKDQVQLSRVQEFDKNVFLGEDFLV